MKDALSKLFYFLSHYIPYIVTSLIMGGFILLWARPNFTGDYAGFIQTHDFDRKYEEVWNWLYHDPDDYRVLWLPAPYPTLFKGLDKAGYDPVANLAGKPVLYAGRLMSPKFVTYLIKTLYEDNTKNLSKLLGISNVKYVIFDEDKRTTVTDSHYVDQFFPEMKFTNEKLLRTLQGQNGLTSLRSTKIMSEKKFRIYKNDDFMPHIFPVDRAGVVAGDLNSLSRMTYMENLSLEDVGLIFANQIDSKEISLLNQLPNTTVLINENSYLDIVMAFVPEEYKFQSTTYYTARTPDRGWAPLTWRWYKREYLASLDNLSFTFIPSEMTIPLDTKENGTYNIYLKCLSGQPGSSISVYCNGEKIGHFSYNKGDERNVQWVNASPFHIEKGRHKIVIKNEHGENAVGPVAIVPQEIMEHALESFEKFLNDKRIILALSSFSDTTQPVEHSLYIPREGLYDITLRGLSTSPQSRLTLNVNTHKFSLLSSNEGNSRWYKVGKILLNKGFTKISLLAEDTGKVYIDQLILDSSDEAPNLSPVSLTAIKINPARYMISYNSDHPFYIFFSEAYDTHWKIKLNNGNYIRSYPAYSFGNLFYIEKNGESKVELVFERQKFVNAGYVFSIATIVLLSTYFLWDCCISKRSNQL